MALSVSSILILCLMFFVIALVYSSVGFGGGSSYLALFALFALSFYSIRSNALVCNIAVVSGSLYWFVKKGCFYGKDFFPFIITSIPMAYLGATYRLSEQWFFILLGIILVISSVFLIGQTKYSEISNNKTTSPYLLCFLGLIIGFISGLVSVGGGVFLAPILYYINWGTPKKIAALSCAFIFVNSIAGLIGLIVSGTLELSFPMTFLLLCSVILGGQIGIRISLKNLSSIVLKRITALLIFIIGMRVLLINGLELM